MKHKHIFGILALFLFGLTACEQVVQLDLESDTPKVIINGQISNLEDDWVINLSMTQPYFDQEDLIYVSDAEVIISDDEGNADTLEYVGNGDYIAVGPKACEVGRTYMLTVKHQGNTYTAQEECAYQEPIDFIKSYFLPDNNGFIERGYYVFEKAQEYEPDGDFYMWKVYRNDTSLRDEIGFQLDTDEFRESGYWNINIDSSAPLKDIDKGIFPRPFPVKFELNDKVRVEQYRISAGYFDFLSNFATQQSRSGTPFDPPPSNPPSNILGGAYGYFSVVNISAKEIIIEP